MAFSQRSCSALPGPVDQRLNLSSQLDELMDFTAELLKDIRLPLCAQKAQLLVVNICYLALFDWDNTDAANDLVSSLYLLLFITSEALVSISLLV
mmetsp:Transcript_12064/g.18175  ORF Transcript_12064/g.18175 Transcript_12064/m.18175 type:complete len:95 (+) Transcript_12064:374-658(+)